jgi:hypothetical protein
MKDSRFLTIAALISVSICLAACAPYRPASGKAAYCNQLNSQMIFGGSTSDTRLANIQEAEMPMVAHSYEKRDCE